MTADSPPTSLLRPLVEDLHARREQIKLGHLFPYRAGPLLRLSVWRPRGWDEALKYEAALHELIRKHLPDIRWGVVQWNGQSYVAFEQARTSPDMIEIAGANKERGTANHDLPMHAAARGRSPVNPFRDDTGA